MFKTFFQNYVNDLLNCLKKAVCCQGRARRREFWSYLITYIIIASVLGSISCAASFVANFLGSFFASVTGLILLALFIPLISVYVRRLHDLNLSGFWFWYLSTFGLPVIYTSHILDVDPSCSKIIARIDKVGSVWLGWILIALFWSFGAPVVSGLLLLYRGKNEANDFGTSPYEA